MAFLFPFLQKFEVPLLLKCSTVSYICLVYLICFNHYVSVLLLFAFFSSILYLSFLYISSQILVLHSFTKKKATRVKCLTSGVVKLSKPPPTGHRRMMHHGVIPNRFTDVHFVPKFSRSKVNCSDMF